MNEPQKKTEWLTPQNMIALLGMGLAVAGSVQAFQQDASKRIDKAEFRLDAAEKAASRNDSRLDNIDKAGVEMNLRLDRLERRTP